MRSHRGERLCHRKQQGAGSDRVKRPVPCTTSTYGCSDCNRYGRRRGQKKQGLTNLERGHRRRRARRPGWQRQPTRKQQQAGSAQRDEDGISVVNGDLEVGAVSDIGHSEHEEARRDRVTPDAPAAKRLGSRQDQHGAPGEYQQPQELDREVERDCKEALEHL